jgi:hypothetical protein
MPRSSARFALAVLLSGLLTTAVAAAEVLPEPTEPLRDFVGKAVIILDLPAVATDRKDERGEPIQEPGIATWIDLRQSFVWPDRILIQRGDQVTLVQGNVEIDYSPAVGYIVERVYRNLDKAPQNPIRSIQFSMATYARLLREMPNPRLLPSEDLERLADLHRARIAELDAQRKNLRRPEEIPLFNSLSAEMVRRREDIELIPFRRQHPCYIVQFANSAVLETLFARGLLADRSVTPLLKGTTTFWVTREHGLPLKMEVTDDRGHVVIYYGFNELKVNTGLRPADLSVNAPRGTRRLSAGADMTDSRWEEKMERELQRQIRDADRARRGTRPR